MLWWHAVGAALKEYKTPQVHKQIVTRCPLTPPHISNNISKLRPTIGASELGLLHP